MKRKIALFLVLLLIFTGTSPQAYAQSNTPIVSNLEELQNAIYAAEDGDTIILANEITVTDHKIIGVTDKILTLKGENDEVGTFFNVSSSSGIYVLFQNFIFDCSLTDCDGVIKFSSPSGVLTCNDIRWNNSGGSGIYIEDGQGKLRSCSFVGCSSQDGAAIYINEGASCFASDCSFTDNTASENGGSVYNGGSFRALRCTFTGNRATLGGAVYGLDFTGENTAVISNTAEKGGGVYTIQEMSLSECLIYNNLADIAGSDLYAEGNAAIQVEDYTSLYSEYLSTSSYDLFGWYSDDSDARFQQGSTSLPIDTTTQLNNVALAFGRSYKEPEPEPTPDPEPEVTPTPDPTPEPDQEPPETEQEPEREPEVTPTPEPEMPSESEDEVEPAPTPAPDTGTEPEPEQPETPSEPDNPIDPTPEPDVDPEIPVDPEPDIPTEPEVEDTPDPEPEQIPDTPTEQEPETPPETTPDLESDNEPDIISPIPEPVPTPEAEVIIHYVYVPVRETTEEEEKATENAPAPSTLVLRCGVAEIDNTAVEPLLSGLKRFVPATKKLTRGEAAALLYGLLTAESQAAFGTSSSYSDMSGSPYETAVAVLSNSGVFSGSTDGVYRPDDTISFAELLTALVHFVEPKTAYAGSFAGHWAEQAAITAVAYGWIDDLPLNLDAATTYGTFVNLLIKIYDL